MNYDQEELWNELEEHIARKQETGTEHSENIQLNCKNCDNHYKNFITDIKAGAIVCKNCGLVQEISIFTDEAEWNNYIEEGVMKTSGNRCGNKPLDYTNPYDTGSTYIPKNLVSYRYDPEGKKIYYSLYKLAIRTSYTSKQRAFNEGKYSFEHIQSRLELSEIVFNTAKLFWGIILKTDILKRGGNRRGMKACCVFYACIVEKQQRGREEIAQAFEIDGTNDFTKGEKIFREIFEKNTEHSWVLYKNADNEQMYARYISQFGLPFRVNRLMKNIKDDCKDHFLGVAAKSEIAGILYFCVKDVLGLKKPNKTEISNQIGVCNPTLTKVLNIIKYFYQKNPQMLEDLRV